MSEKAVEVEALHRSYGRNDALRGLDMTVGRGRCHGLFGRNGAGKTTALKCLINHLRPDRGKVRVFGMNPSLEEVAVKSRIGYVPDEVAFYPWMTVRKTLDYMASFRAHWNLDLERELLGERFGLDDDTRVDALSKGMKAQLALICALCPEPELLVLDEPTSGLDPAVRREFLETVIGTYQAETSVERTILVSTHLITEFEGLVDSFTIIDGGQDWVSMDAEEARRRFKKVWLQFDGEPPAFDGPEVLDEERAGRDVKWVVYPFSEEVEEKLRALGPLSMRVEDLGLEEIFLACARGGS